MNKIISACNLCIVLCMLSCKSPESKEQGFREIKDDLGRKIKVKKNPARVMALSSSLTEMLYLICPDSQIIARTQNCNYPPQVLNKPLVNNYPIDYEKILLLKPDVIVGKDGIVSMEEASRLEAMGIPFYFQHYDRIRDIYQGIEELGELLNRKERAKEAADSLHQKIDSLKASVKNLNTPKVLFIISLERIYVFGKDSYVTDVIESAGGINAVDKIFNNPFPQITSEYIMEIDPEVIIIMGEENISITTVYPELAQVKAVKTGRIFSFPEDLVSRPGPRIGLAVEKLISYLHPQVIKHEK